MLENKLFSKIFMWMFIGLTITFGVGYYVSLNPNMIYNIFGSFWWIILIAEFVVVIVLSAKIRTLKPDTAKILFCLYSFLTGLTFSTIFIVYQITSIIYVFLTTAILCLVLSFLANKTKIDLTKIGTYLIIILLGILVLSIINIFVKSTGLDLGLCIVGLILFMIYIGYDIQVIKRNLYGLPEENLAIYGALELYLDFINIFIRLLQLFGRGND